jgi:ketosteroid isomerase-like protein
MSEENVESVKAGFAALSRGDLDALVEMYDPEAVFETLLLGTHHGKEAIRRIHAENLDNQSGYTVEPIEMIDAGDKVITVVQVGGAGPVSQIALDDRFAFVHTMKNGLIVRDQAFRNREEAVDAGGWSD